jgi:hypothetical protein
MKRRPFLGILILLTVLSCNRSTPTGSSDPVECEGAGDKYVFSFLRTVGELTNPAVVDEPMHDPKLLQFWWYGNQYEELALVRENSYTFVTKEVFVPFNNTQSHHVYVVDMLTYPRPVGHRILATNTRTGETFEITQLSVCTHKTPPGGEMGIFGKYCDGDIR